MSYELFEVSHILQDSAVSRGAAQSKRSTTRLSKRLSHRAHRAHPLVRPQQNVKLSWYSTPSVLTYAVQETIVLHPQPPYAVTLVAHAHSLPHMADSSTPHALVMHSVHWHRLMSPLQAHPYRYIMNGTQFILGVNRVALGHLGPRVIPHGWWVDVGGMWCLRHSTHAARRGDGHH
ncbi:hypothetical protein EI94DRAFT_885398 [Lactarius quietus]|nr:hypothetical protein EI94DRAFT_224796 [Lactarius quietus]KAF8260612.1 hypothetical protein EI94DRAFT_885398 [Lactarius quietus]